MAEKTLTDIKAYSLSNDDINEILEPDTRIISYPAFQSMTSIDDAFDSLGRCVFLFLTEGPGIGHWLCMFKRENNTIEYFDSYGEKPEAQRNWISQEQLDDLDESEPYLMNLLRESRCKIFYNTVKYQKKKDDYNSCGRWVVARLICKDMTDKQFYNLIQSQMKEKGIKEMDDWVAIFTYDFLGK